MNKKEDAICLEIKSKNPKGKDTDLLLSIS